MLQGCWGDLLVAGEGCLFDGGYVELIELEGGLDELSDEAEGGDGAGSDEAEVGFGGGLGEAIAAEFYMADGAGGGGGVVVGEEGEVGAGVDGGSGGGAEE